MASETERFCNELTHGKRSLTDVMRMAKLIAATHGFRDHESWITNELEGYPTYKELPSYRLVNGIEQEWHSDKGFETKQNGSLAFHAAFVDMPIDGKAKLFAVGTASRFILPCDSYEQLNRGVRNRLVDFAAELRRSAEKLSASATSEDGGKAAETRKWLSRIKYVRTLEKTYLLPKTELQQFTPDILGLGNIRAVATKDCLAAVFDLEGFSTFCNARDPHLFVPKFLEEFLTWITGELRAPDAAAPANEDDAVLRHPLPLYAKFLGDGLLILWDVAGQLDEVVDRISETCRLTTEQYRLAFVPAAMNSLSLQPPVRLRCGVARGNVLSIDGNDFVGPCINAAARLQSLPGITFAVSSHGLSSLFRKNPDYKRVTANLRGIGKEMVYVLKAELETLDPRYASLYAE
jgi:class 3 adenylate cyclase